MTPAAVAASRAGLNPADPVHPLAEETGLIVQLGKWVVQKACEQSKAWEQAGINNISIAINVSSRQFCHGDLLDSILRIVAETGVRPQNVELEITESLLMRDDAAICAAILAMARELGLSVVAEGVELEEQLDFLRRHNCDQVQGFLISRPLPAERFEKFFHSYSHQHMDIKVDNTS